MSQDASVSATQSLFDAVRRARIVDLSQRFESGMPVFPTHPQFFAVDWDTHDPAAMNLLLVGEHAGTHVDSPSHFYRDGSDSRSVSISDVPLDRTVGPARLIDARDSSGGGSVNVAFIREWEERQQRNISSEDAVIFRFGWAEKWGTFDAAAAYLQAWPGLTPDAAEYLVSRDVRAVGTDCLGIDGVDSSDLRAHYILLEHGVLIIENLCALDQLPPEFLLVTLPLKIKGGTGSPVRAVALVPDMER